MGKFKKISDYYKSFSGTDTLAFILMPGCAPVLIGSLTTISYSMFRNKKPVINIGRTNINGVTRGSRIYAGTMIFTLINQHWLRELQSQPQLEYLKGFNELKVDELPLFDVMIISANEYGNAVSMYIYGIDFTDEAQTISVEDLFTENVFSFVARDVSTFKAIDISTNEQGYASSNDDDVLSVARLNVSNTFTQSAYILPESSVVFEELGEIEQQLYYSKLKDMEKPQVKTIPRDLYLNNSKLMMGNDVSIIQTLLKPTFPDININGIFDSDMDNYIRKYQSMINTDINGVVDTVLYNTLLNSVFEFKDTYLGVIVNKSGTFGYKFMSLQSDICNTIPYKEQVEIHGVVIDDSDGYKQKWYSTNKGYVIAEDVYSAYSENNVVEFPIVKYGETSVYANIVCSLLSELFPTYRFNNTIDDLAIRKIKELQQEHGLVETGEVDNETWLLLQTLTGNVKQEISQETLKLSFTRYPDKYNINMNDLFHTLSTFTVKVLSDININIKATAIAYFDEDKTDIKSKTIAAKKDTEISLIEFQPVFAYNTEYGSCPNRIEWVIYPFNQQPYKWTFYCNK